MHAQTTDAPSSTLPSWDMTTIYPAVDSPEYAASINEIERHLTRLEELLSDAEAGPTDAGPEVTAAFEGLLAEVEAIADIAHRNLAYLSGFVTVDSRDGAAQAGMSELRILLARYRKATTRFTAWIGHIDVEALIEDSAQARLNAFPLRQARTSAAHLMAPSQEELAAELSLSGGKAWSQLYDDVSSQITVPVELVDGTVQELSMPDVRNLALHPDRAQRQRAYEAELAAWKRWETPIAAALNGVTGEHGTLAGRRHWDSVLDEALFQNHIDRETLDAMMTAAREAFPDFRRYFQAKARMLGLERLAFHDLFAPLGDDERQWSWDEALEFVAEQFGTYSSAMRDLVTRAVEERWIDVPSRPGKVGGAFCMEVGNGESRVLLNYTPSFDSVSTLAHELGHAYHNLCEAGVTPWRRSSTPMTLAETASTFCETILRKAAIARGTEREALAILEGSLQDAAQIVVDITSRFLFEQAVFERRPQRALSADEFSALMLEAQRETYGEGLDQDALHPYMWAAKGHYYSPTAAFYNFPYMFGLLFGLGLYARYQEAPDSFRARYDHLLASTGDADAADLAARFGIDTRSPAFWRSSLDVIRGDIDQFAGLAERQAAQAG